MLRPIFLVLIFLSILVTTTTIKTNVSASQKPANIISITTYDYDTLTKDLNHLKYRHSDLIDYWSLGQSVYGREIYVVSLGKGEASIYIDGSRHGREWISTYINMKMIEEYANAMTYGDGMYGEYNVKEILDQVTFYFIPMVNPDGVDLSIHGLTAFSTDVHESLLTLNDGDTNFKRWKANGLGLDLNRNWDAGWDSILNSPPGPSWSHHKGMEPFDNRAVEDLLIREFIYDIDPEIVVSYHSTGRILYWWWGDLNSSLVAYHRNIASKVSALTKYPIYPKNRPHTNGGGMSDWFIKEFQRPGLTLELAPQHDNQPVHLKWFAEEWERNKYVGLAMAEEAYTLWWKRIGEQQAIEKVQLTKEMENHWAYGSYKELYMRGILSEPYINFSSALSPETFATWLDKAKIQADIEIKKSSFHRLDLVRMLIDRIKPNFPTVDYVMNYGHYAATFQDLHTIYFPHRFAIIAAYEEGLISGYHSNFRPYQPVTYAEALVVIHRLLADEQRLQVPSQSQLPSKTVNIDIGVPAVEESFRQQLDVLVDYEVETVTMLIQWAGLKSIPKEYIQNVLASQSPEELLNEWFPGHVVALSSENFKEIEMHILKGYPVMSWLIDRNSLVNRQYTVLITGIDDAYVYVNNPLTGKQESYQRQQFIDEWAQANKQSLSLKLETD